MRLTQGLYNGCCVRNMAINTKTTYREGCYGGPVCLSGRGDAAINATQNHLVATLNWLSMQIGRTSPFPVTHWQSCVLGSCCLVMSIPESSVSLDPLD